MKNKVQIVNLNVIKNPSGSIYKYLDKKKSYFKKPAEIYFSEIKKNKIKGWILHKKNTCFLAVIHGNVQFKIKDKLNKKIITIKISPKNYKLIIVPPKNSFMFQGIAKNSIIINSIQQLHDSKESVKSPYKKNEQ